MRFPCRRILTAGVVAAAATLAACGDSSAPDDDPLPDNAATAVGLTVRDNVEASLDAFYPVRLLQPFTTGAVDDPCVNPSAATDSDGDGVPDEANYNFTAPPCRFTGVRGFTIDVVGQLRIVDPAPKPPASAPTSASPVSASASAPRRATWSMTSRGTAPSRSPEAPRASSRK